MQKTKSCECHLCVRSRDIQEHLDLVNDPIIRKGLRRLILEIDHELEIANTDNGRLEAIIAGTWHNADEVMNKAGWVRKQEEAEFKPFNAYIKSHSVFGTLLFEGYGVVIERRAHGASYLVRCQDGVEREVFLSSNKYPKDRLQMVGQK
ncbi:hypothetical protein KASHIRA_01110 [Serratia phage vB_SmaM-Kashira]|nr:hypothetical protein KASHIRA_01110 [Serratia phage vB_SmaM-Kashira]